MIIVMMRTNNLYSIFILFVGCLSNDNLSIHKWMLEKVSLSISEKIKVEDFYYNNDYGKIIKIKLDDSNISYILNNYNFEKIDTDRAKSKIIQISDIAVSNFKSKNVYSFQEKQPNMILDVESKSLILEVLHPDMGGDFYLD